MKSSELIDKLSNKQIMFVLIPFGVTMAILILVGTLSSITKFADKRNERLKQQSQIGILNDTEDWPKPFQELHQQLIMPGGEMTVCNALGGSRIKGQRVVMCKITGSAATWRLVRQKFGLQRVEDGVGSRWRMEQSSVRGDFSWWPKAGESPVYYYANEDFLNDRKAIHFQAAHYVDTVMYVHCTIPAEK
ncbi:MAG: hypothetical protein AAFN77_09965 [Planctomycetota bacterium]